MDIKEIIIKVWGDDSGKPWSESAMQHLELFAELLLEQERKEAAEHYLKMIRDCVATEREACAKVAEAEPKVWRTDAPTPQQRIAAAIRARGDKHEV